jgi:hypothetical protein
MAAWPLWHLVLLCAVGLFVRLRLSARIGLRAVSGRVGGFCEVGEEGEELC